MLARHPIDCCHYLTCLLIYHATTNAYGVLATPPPLHLKFGPRFPRPQIAGLYRVPPWQSTCESSSKYSSIPSGSAFRSARLPVNLIGSPINYANRLIGSPITSQSTGCAQACGQHSRALNTGTVGGWCSYKGYKF